MQVLQLVVACTMFLSNLFARTVRLILRGAHHVPLCAACRRESSMVCLRVQCAGSVHDASPVAGGVSRLHTDPNLHVPMPRAPRAPTCHPPQTLHTRTAFAPRAHIPPPGGIMSNLSALWLYTTVVLHVYFPLS